MRKVVREKNWKLETDSIIENEMKGVTIEVQQVKRQEPAVPLTGPF